MNTVDSQLSLFGHIEQQGDGSYEEPDSIITSVISARAMFETLRRKHIKRINLIAEIEGLIQGNPPYNPEELRAAGLQHIANFNDMSARALMKRSALQYFNLLHNSQYLVNFQVNLKTPDAPYFAEVLSKNWQKAVQTEWPSFYVNMADMQMQLVKIGLSPVIFPDERDPRWRVIELAKFYVPDLAQSDLDQLTTVMVENEFTVQYLWSCYKKFANTPDDESPWNTKVLGRLLAYLSLSPNKENITPQDVYDREKKILSGDISMDRMFSDSVRIISLFQREYDGTISHYMFHRTYDEGADFLFKVEHQYDHLREALIIFTLHPGEHTLHSNRGYGHEIYSLAQAKIQADCSIVDMMKWASTPIIKSPSLSTKDIEQIKFYPGVPTNIGSAELVQNNLGANVQEIVSGAQYIKGEIQYNISYSGSDAAQPDPNSGSISPRQTTLMAFREFSVLKNQVLHHYISLDHCFQTMTAKMIRTKDAYPGSEIGLRWRELCESDLSKQIVDILFDVSKTKDRWRLPPHLECYATRAAGAGSQVAQLLGLQELQPFVGTFGQNEGQFFKRQIISATVGPEFIQAYTQDDNENDEKAGGASLAGVENAIMQAGKAPIFSPDNEHRAHFTVHTTLARSIIQQIQQDQMDVVTADSIFTVCVPHMQEHLQALSQNVFAQDFVAKAKPMYDDIAKYAALNRKNAARAAQAKLQQQQQLQQKNQDVMSEEQLKTMQTLNEEHRKDIKLGSQIQRQKQAGDAKEQALQEKTQADVQAKLLKSTTDAQMKRLQAEFSNQANSEMQANPSGYIDQLNGDTPAPYDLETPASADINSPNGTIPNAS